MLIGTKEYTGSWCPQCGPDVSCDEDGCCVSCGSAAVGEGAEQALHWRAAVGQKMSGQNHKTVRRANSKANYGIYIDRLIEYLRSFGVKVNLPAVHLKNEFGADVIGTYDKESATICIDCHSTIDVLRTLAHEAGHWLSYRLLPQVIDNMDPPQKELIADALGWEILKKLQACKILTWDDFIFSGSLDEADR